MHASGSRRSRPLVVLAALLALTACERMLPTAPEIEAMDVRSTERFRYAPSFWMDSTLLYFVDGVPASAERSRAIPAEFVASIRLTRDREGWKQSELHVTTSTVAGVTKAIECEQPIYCQDAPSPEGGPGEILPGAGDAVTRGWMNPRAVRRFAGLVIVDGTELELINMGRIDVHEIESLEILKGSTAQQIYSDPRAAYGVVRITTWMKDGVCPTDFVEGRCPSRDVPRPVRRYERPTRPRRTP